MKNALLILCLSICLRISAQAGSYSQEYTVSGGLYNSTDLFSSGMETEEVFYLSQFERINLSNYNSFNLPSPPLLTTNPADLEICTGNSTRLTASSNNLIYWYTTPPPLGSPVGTGTSYITPALTAGYYTYYAIADNGGVKSDITAMEVVMVYPSPVLNIQSNVNTLCANETATLTVTGTTYYEWENGPVASQITIRPLNTQTYKVTGVNTAGCKSTALYTQSVEMCVVNGGQDAINSPVIKAPPISFNDESRLFSVYPNPNNGDFNIRVGSISESTKIEVYNWFGELAYSSRVTSEISAVTLKDNLNGIYIVRIIENDKVLNQQKIVKE